jgi:hypothetical protein
MRKQLFTVAFCGVLLFLVGLLWWRVQELEKVVDSLKEQRASNSTVVWQNDKLKTDTGKKSVFKLIDSTPATDPQKSKVGVPWDVERAMVGRADRSREPMQRLNHTREK